MPETTPKHQVKSISITRAEGPSHLCGIQHSVECFSRANSILSSWVDMSASHYDKVDFTVTWAVEDGEDVEWTGTYLLMHGQYGPSLNQHIRNYAEVQAGLHRPDAYNDDNWATHLANIEHTKAQYLTFLEKCDLRTKQGDTQ